MCGSITSLIHNAVTFLVSCLGFTLDFLMGVAIFGKLHRLLVQTPLPPFSVTVANMLYICTLGMHVVLYHRVTTNLGLTWRSEGVNKKILIPG